MYLYFIFELPSAFAEFFISSEFIDILEVASNSGQQFSIFTKREKFTGLLLSSNFAKASIFSNSFSVSESESSALIAKNFSSSSSKSENDSE